jgi:hypothetical protein
MKEGEDNLTNGRITRSLRKNMVRGSKFIMSYGVLFELGYFELQCVISTLLDRTTFYFKNNIK